MAALLDLRMPGVYTQEIPTLPPTIGIIPSAVPVFIGYTEKAEKKGESLSMKPTRVKSMKEFEDWFGGPERVKIKVTIDDRKTNPLRPEVRIVKPVSLTYKMYHSMLFYYANGGGPCFVMSVGNYNDGVNDEALKNGIPPLTKVKDITILIFPDGTSVAEDKYAGIITEALNHCVKMKNRVTVIDVNEANGEDLTKIEDGFQTSMPSDIEIKKYGMAYYPYVETIFTYAYNKDEVIIGTHTMDADVTPDAELMKLNDAVNTSRTAYQDALKGVKPLKQEKDILTFFKKELEDWKAAQGAPPNDAALKTQLEKIVTDSNKVLPDSIKTKLDPVPDVLKLFTDTVVDLEGKITTAETEVTNKKKAFTDATTEAKKKLPKGGKTVFSLVNLGMDVLEDVSNQVYGKIKDAISNFPVTLPPCGAIAGIYVRTDATQGVWKAPANVSVFAGIKPSLEIDDDLHANLNAPSSGKAINVIRTYPGRGLLVYGGRTLAGNDLEWRYVNVRRTFCFIEDSVARAMQDFVFEPNTQQTWIKVRAMIRSFLNRLWKAGGLYGNTPEDAYEVIVSEPESMSVEDVLSGIMRIFIKVAVARPAEFIVLQYEHKFELTES